MAVRLDRDFGGEQGSGGPRRLDKEVGAMVVVFVASKGRSCSRGGDIERPAMGSEVVLWLAPDMARSRVRASRSVCVCERGGASGVLGQGTGVFSSKGAGARGGVTRSAI